LTAGTPRPLRFLPVGESALSVEFGDAIDPALNARVRGLDRVLGDEGFPGFREAIPTYRALLVLYDPRATRYAEACAHLRRLAEAAPAGETAGALHVVPTRYGGEDGPDLAEVARRHGLGETEVVGAHASAEYTAFMLGFTPGLGLLPEALATPRRSTPRVRVPAGSVAIAGRQTGIYPVASPGGWSLIGRTSVRLFDPFADPPSLIQPGDRVRFAPVDALPPPPPPLPPPSVGAAPALEVIAAGLLTTVQDEGRAGWRRLGVSGSGAADAPALRAANRCVGNPPGAAGLEVTAAGPRLRFLAPVSFSVTGADLSPVLHREGAPPAPVPHGARMSAAAGHVLAFGARQDGFRAYVAFAGGIDVPPVLGSRCTDLAGGFGGLAGRALRRGDHLALGTPAGDAGPPAGAPRDRAARDVSVRVILGPQDDHFTPATVATFLGEAYAVTPESDRTGCRLRGPALAHAGAAEIVTDGMVPGCIQVPPDGQPIVMLAAAPSTGGYPKIATVVGTDLPRLAQLLPGEGRVRFRAVTVEEAQDEIVRIGP
jgi:KipI family sensor histidine kinase inhibitor